MPYILTSERECYEPHCPAATSAGELNFQLTCLIKKYIDTWGLNYQHINDVVGALEGAKLEFYRRIAVPYEQTKIDSNGDVYDVQ